MRRAALGATVVTACLLLAGCATTTGSGDVVTEKRPVSGFSAIDLQGVGEVRVTVTGTESLTIEAEENLLPLLRAEVTGDRLVLSTRQPIRPTEDVVFTVTAATLDGLEVSGSGSITVDAFRTADLTLRVSGSGVIGVTDVDTDRVDVDLTGSGAVGVTGDAASLDVSVSGSGSFDGEGLAVEDAEVSVSGSGDVVVNATRSLDVSVSGSGNVRYLGDPSLSVDASGSGNVSGG